MNTIFKLNMYRNMSDKLKEKFKSKKEKSNDIYGASNTIKSYGYFNDTSEVVFLAGKACYKGKTDNATYHNILKFIEERIKVGHESIIEHTNFLVALSIPYKYLEELIEVISCCRYLNVKTEPVKVSNGLKNINKIFVNIAGSIRGYKHIYRNISDMNNIVLKHITNLIYQNIPKEYFVDFIKDGIFNENDFCTIEENKKIKYGIKELNFSIPNDINNKKITLIHADCIEDLYKDQFPIRDQVNWYKDLLTITVKFTGLSRYSTHQLVRHRNGITQESQRYVDYSDMPMNNPLIYNKSYDPNKKYKIPSSDFITFNKDGLTTEELCTVLQSIYKPLKEQGMKPEEARAFAPSGIRSGDLYMTFTYSSLAKFLELRMDSHAQAEIREWANTLHEYIQNIPELRELIDNPDGTLSNLLIKPTYELLANSNDESFYDDIDEEVL